MAFPTDQTVSRLGAQNQGADTRALFLKLFAGEVLTAFEEKNIAMGLHRVRTISGGKSASFPMTGKIVVKESLEPFNTNNPAVDIKYAGDTGVACSIKGMPIYRTTFFTADVNAVSELLKHDNGAQIREANSKGQAVESLQALKAEPVEAEASPF